MIRRPPRSPLFPSTTLFRSLVYGRDAPQAFHVGGHRIAGLAVEPIPDADRDLGKGIERSEEHTSELQSPCNLVCRLLLEKKKTSEQRDLITKDVSAALQ